MSVVQDEYLDKITKLELSNSSGDQSLTRITELLKLTYHGFAITQQKIIESSTGNISDTQTKLTQLQHGIDAKLQDLANQIGTSSTKLASQDQAMRQMDATLQNMAQGNCYGAFQGQQSRPIM